MARVHDSRLCQRDSIIHYILWSVELISHSVFGKRSKITLDKFVTESKNLKGNISDRLLKAMDGILFCISSMPKEDIINLPDLTKWNFYDFDVHAYSQQYHKIGVYFQNEDIVIVILATNGVVRCYKTTYDTQNKNVSKLEKDLVLLCSCLRGDEFEKSFIHIAAKKHLSEASWKEKMEFEETYLFYQDLHDYMIDFILMILEMETFKTKKKCRVLDIFGGDGGLLIKLRERIKNIRKFDSIQFELVYIDSDHYMFTQAKKRFVNACDCQFQVSPILFDLRSSMKPQIEMFDLILCSGGLTGEVITSKDALSITKWVYSILKTMGIFISTGKAESHINREILSTIGFYVSNCAMMDKDMKFGIIHHYVSMKLETPQTVQPSLATLLQSVS